MKLTMLERRVITKEYSARSRRTSKQDPRRVRGKARGYKRDLAAWPLRHGSRPEATGPSVALGIVAGFRSSTYRPRSATARPDKARTPPAMACENRSIVPSLTKPNPNQNADTIVFIVRIVVRPKAVVTRASARQS